MPTIIITGGHHNSALVVAKLLIKKDCKVIWIGHRHSSRGDMVDSAEYTEVTGSGIKFHDLHAGKMVLSLREIFQFPLGVSQAYKLLKKIKPTAILSFGGYLGGTVALSGKALNIPIYLHEQTVTAGRANKLIGKLAKKIYLTWPDSAKYFSAKKTQVIGLPLRDGILVSPKKSFFNRRKPTLLVMGGKQGAHALNHFIFNNMSDLLTHFNLIHQTGTSSLTGDYESALALKNTLGSLSDCYLPLGYIGEQEIGDYLHNAAYYLGRSGAHICYELGVVGLKSILVPLMSTHDHEQHKNASILVKAKLGVILAQSDLKLSSFLTSYNKLASQQPSKLNLADNAGELLVKDLLSELNK
ncbi:glycosyltransferase [Candidatus Woesebacteria bacterium]|nr:glycosyltransferase [Candidatus Woesebacteria bacterium]